MGNLMAGGVGGMIFGAILDARVTKAYRSILAAGALGGAMIGGILHGGLRPM